MSEVVRCPNGGVCNACVSSDHCREGAIMTKNPFKVLDENSPAMKFDGDKVDLSLMPTAPIMAVGRVWTFGKKKYSAYNWTKGFAYSRPIGACLRHIFAWMAGQDKDTETGESHLAHAICCLMMLIEFQDAGTGEDDRYKRGKV